jgi:metal-responsive CopG/Arc/MetJ family transcriptional regulator
MGKLRKGKSVVQAIVKEEIVKTLDEIAKKELTSRSAIAGKIIEENLEKYKKPVF